MESIENILQNIPGGCCFDSHFVTECLRKDYSDDYLWIAKNINATDNLTLATHQRIGNLIAEFEGRLVERQAQQSCSLNIHGKASSCALWKRL
jgi:hypothetical protein